MAALDYRNQASSHLTNAKTELATGEDHRLRYSALELRFAMEALTYERAKAFKDELPPSELETWQPRKLLISLLEIDDTADKDSSLAIGVEEEFGGEAPVMSSLGTETVFNLRMLKKHYDAMGNYLHVPTLNQAENSPPSSEKLRKRCTDIVDYLEKVLSSPVWNVNFAHFSSLKCENCGTNIRKRLPRGKEKLMAECFNCSATYTVTDVGKGKVHWQLDLIDVPCGNGECGHITHILRKERKEGSAWTCASCEGRNVLALCVKNEPVAVVVNDASDVAT